MRIGIVCPYSFAIPGGVQYHVRDLADRAGVDLDNLQASVDRATEAAETTASEMVNSAAEQARGMTSQSNM